MKQDEAELTNEAIKRQHYIEVQTVIVHVSEI